MENFNDYKKYEDIINLPRHISKTHPQMSIYDRSAQFAPFAALTNHTLAIKETGRLTNEKIIISNDEIKIINEKLNFINYLDDDVKVTLTYFVPDELKDGGEYKTFTGVIKKIDDYKKTVVFENKTRVDIDDIYSLIIE